MTLSFLHAPRSVAVLGASDDPQAFGGRPLRYLREFGYRGTVVPVRRGGGTVQGLPACPALSRLPDLPDVALVTVPGQEVADTVAECAAMGIPGMIVFASGLGEIDDSAGSELRRQMETAVSSGTRLVGPNAQALANFANGAVLTPWGVSDEEPAADGPVAVVSQSGAMCSMIYGALRRRGIGVRYAHGVGAGLDVSVGELTSAVLDDPQVRLVLLYLEDLSDPAELARAAATAADRGTPVVALVGGRSSAGQQAAMSHSGALATEDRLVDAFFQRTGMWRATNATELLAAAELHLRAPEPRGRRLAVVSNSGATCVLAADAAADRGMPLARLTAGTHERLRAVLSPFAMHANPVDVMGLPMADPDLLGKVLAPLGEDPGTDVCLVALPVAGPAYDVERFVADAARFGVMSGLPLAVAAPQREIRDAFRRAGIPAFDEEAAAIAGLAQFTSHHERMAEARDRMPISPAARPDGRTRVLNEHEGLGLLARLGVPVVPRVLCADARAAGLAFDRLGGAPVVVKGCTAQATHKSELGLVHLGPRTREAAEDAASAVIERMRSLGLAADGVLVSPMVSATREVMVGARVDPTFGPVVVVGNGGRYVEALPDVELLLPPFGVEDVVAAIRRLACAPLLDGVRGEPAVDVSGWAEIAVRLGDAMTDPSPQLVELDANPVLLGGDAGSGLVVDAVAVVSEPAASVPLRHR